MGGPFRANARCGSPLRGLGLDEAFGLDGRRDDRPFKREAQRVLDAGFRKARRAGRAVGVRSDL